MEINCEGDATNLSLEEPAMESTYVTLTVRGTTSPGEVIAVVGSCESLGNWCYQRAVTLQPTEADGTLWKKTITVPRGAVTRYRYFKGSFLENKISPFAGGLHHCVVNIPAPIYLLLFRSLLILEQVWVRHGPGMAQTRSRVISNLDEAISAGGPCQVIVTRWETHLHPRALNPSAVNLEFDDGQFGFHNGAENVDSGWLTCQTEIRLRLHYSIKPPVSFTKKKFKKSRFRFKLTIEGVEEEDDDEEELPIPSPSPWKNMTPTLEISMITAGGYKSRHSQPEDGYALEPMQWTEYSIQTMDPDNLELTFQFFEEDLSVKVVQGDIHPGHVGTACLLSSSFVESGKDAGMATLPIMSRSAGQTMGKVRVDYLVIRPIQDLQCDMQASFTRYWKKRSTLDVGHRGAGSSHAAKHHKVRENTIASFLSAANHGAAYVEFDVHLSKDFVPIVYHDLTCCISTKKKNDKNNLMLFEVPVKDLTYDQLQLLKLAHSTAMSVHDNKDMDEEEDIDDHQPFPSLLQIFQAVPEHVSFNIELKWICHMKDGTWEGNLSSYFDMNIFLDIILTCVFKNAGKRRILFSSFHPDICSMVRQKQNKYPILFLTQGVSDVYPELMDIRCQTTQIAMSFAQSENLLGISAHSEEMLKNMEFISQAQSKGLVMFCWGDDNNNHNNRNTLREQGIDGLIYDRICEEQMEQPNIFQVEEQVSLQEVISKETMQNCACSTYSLACDTVTCPARTVSGESDSGISSS